MRERDREREREREKERESERERECVSFSPFHSLDHTQGRERVKWRELFLSRDVYLQCVAEVSHELAISVTNHSAYIYMTYLSSLCLKGVIY